MTMPSQGTMVLLDEFGGQVLDRKVVLYTLMCGPPSRNKLGHNRCAHPICTDDLKWKAPKKKKWSKKGICIKAAQLQASDGSPIREWPVGVKMYPNETLLLHMSTLDSEGSFSYRAGPDC